MSARDLFGTITSLHFSRSRMFELDRRTVWRRSALCHRACQEGQAAMKNRPLSRVELITSWEKGKDLYDWVERKKEKPGLVALRSVDQTACSTEVTMEIVDDIVLGMPANSSACTQRQIKIGGAGGVQHLPLSSVFSGWTQLCLCSWLWLWMRACVCVCDVLNY